MYIKVFRSMRNRLVELSMAQIKFVENKFEFHKKRAHNIFGQRTKRLRPSAVECFHYETRYLEKTRIRKVKSRQNISLYNIIYLQFSNRMQLRLRKLRCLELLQLLQHILFHGWKNHQIELEIRVIFRFEIISILIKSNEIRGVEVSGIQF